MLTNRPQSSRNARCSNMGYLPLPSAHTSIQRCHLDLDYLLRSCRDGIWTHGSGHHVVSGGSCPADVSYSWSRNSIARLALASQKICTVGIFAAACLCIGCIWHGLGLGTC